jgi:hypothetical protein
MRCDFYHLVLVFLGGFDVGAWLTILVAWKCYGSPKGKP